MPLLRLVALCLLLFVTPSHVLATRSIPISPANVTQLAPLYRIGSPLPQQLSFSPNGDYLVASTTEQTYVYQTDNWEQPPTPFPFTEFEFEEDMLIADGQRWNIETGLSNGITADVRVVSATEDQDNTVVQVVLPGGDIMEVDTGFSYPVLGTAVSEDYSILAVAMRPPRTLPNLSPTVNLYRLPEGAMYAVLPQNSAELSSLFFLNESGRGRLLVSHFTQPQAMGGVLNIYNASYGTPAQYSDYPTSESVFTIQRSPDGRVFSYTNDEKINVVGERIFQQFPAAREPEGYTTLYALGNQHIAIINEARTQVEITNLQTGEVVRVLPFNEQWQSQFYFSDDDRWLVSVSQAATYAWSLFSSQTSPLEVNVEDGFFSEFSTDFSLYSVHTYDGQLSIRDVSTGAIRLELPAEAVLNPDWSQAAYWQGGAVVVKDVSPSSTRLLTLIDGYLGEVADINLATNTAAFIGTRVTLANLSTGSGTPFELPITPTHLQFTRDGQLLLVSRRSSYALYNRIAPALSLWNIATGEQIIGYSENISGAWSIDPLGTYLASE